MRPPVKAFGTAHVNRSVAPRNQNGTDMTDTKQLPKSPADPDVAAGAAQMLGPVVVDLTALVVDGKQAHWHVRGPGFIGVHELLDEVVAHAREYADAAAERVVALGLPIDARLQTVAEKTTAPAMPAGFHQADQAIAAVIAAIDATIKTARAAVDGLAELDPISQDVAVEIARGLEKDRWLLFAHVATK